MTLTYGELFAGYDGLGMGVRSVLGGESRWFAEFDKAPSRILAHHYPGVPNLGDVTKVDWASVPKVDVITGGSPCQDLSHAGKRKGMTDGTRSNLWVEMREAIAVIRPRLVVWENVRGALSAEAASDVEREQGLLGVGRNGPALRAIGRVVGDLASLGYVGRYYGLRAADVGAAHGRFRVFLFAVPADADDQGLQGFADQARASRAGRYGHPESGTGGPALTLLPTPAVNDMGAAYTPETWDAWTERMKASHGNGNGHGKSLSIEAQRLLPTPNTHNWKESGHCRDFGADMTHALLCGCEGARSATEHQADASEELRDMRGTYGAQAVRQEARGLRGVHEAPALQPELREHAGRSTGGLSPLAGASGEEGCDVRGVRDDRTTAHPPQGPGRDKQQTGEPGEPVRELPPSSALARGQGRSHGIDFGPYSAAIERWEAVLGRPAPAPTEQGPNGRHRLSAIFVEFLMGLPDGWVTDVPGITRNDQLKALGNGVVPQQCAAATRAFIHDTRQENAA